MYFNDVHIMYYVFIILTGGFIGQFVDYCSRCFINEKRIFCRESIKLYKKNVLPNYILIFTISITYALLLYKFGLNATDFMKNIDLIKYILLLPMLACAFMVDLKKQIIPNRLTLLIFEVGLALVFIYGISNINMALDMLLGMVAGGGIFLIITLLGGLIAGKEAMGLRRC